MVANRPIISGVQQTDFISADPQIFFGRRKLNLIEHGTELKGVPEKMIRNQNDLKSRTKAYCHENHSGLSGSW